MNSYRTILINFRKIMKSNV